MALTLSNPFFHRNVRLLPSSTRTRKVAAAAESGKLKVTCRRKELHPQIYEDAKVYCNGEHVLTVCGTKQEYVVDMWAGNHPFYLGNRSDDFVDADQVEKFRRKYAGLTEYMEIPVLRGEIVLPPREKTTKKKK